MKISESTKQAVWEAFNDRTEGNGRAFSEVMYEQVAEAFVGCDEFEGWAWESANATLRTKWQNVATFGTERPSEHDKLFSALMGRPGPRYQTDRRTDAEQVVESSWVVD